MRYKQNIYALHRSVVQNSLHKSRNHFKIQGGKKVSWSYLHTENPHILGATLQNLVATLNLFLGFVHLWSRWISFCNGAGGYSPISHRGQAVLIPGQSMWDLWWIKQHWNRVFSENSRFPSVRIIPPMFHFPRYLNTTLVRRTGGRRLRTFEDDDTLSHTGKH